MVVARVEQSVEQNTERIIGIVDVIRNTKFVGVEGLESIRPQDAFAVFRDENRPEGEQEIRILMKDLAETYRTIVTLGRLNQRRWVYSLRRGGEEKEVDAKKFLHLQKKCISGKRHWLREHCLLKIGECRFKPPN